MDDELQAAGLNMVQIRRVRRFFTSEEFAVAGALTFTAAQSAETVAVVTEEWAHGNGSIVDRSQMGGGAGGVAININYPGVGDAEGGVDTGGASTSTAAPQEAAAAVLVVEHDQERNQDCSSFQ